MASDRASDGAADTRRALEVTGYGRDGRAYLQQKKVLNKMRMISISCYIVLEPKSCQQVAMVSKREHSVDAKPT